MSRMGPELEKKHARNAASTPNRLGRRWQAFAPPQRFIVALLPIGFALAFALSLIDSVPTRAALAAERLGIYDLVARDFFGVHPWTWAHFFGWMSLAGAVALVLGRAWWMLFAGGAVFGLSVGIEYMQSSLTNERGYSFDDVVANGSGVLLGVVAALVITHLWHAHVERSTATDTVTVPVP